MRKERCFRERSGRVQGEPQQDSATYWEGALVGRVVRRQRRGEGKKEQAGYILGKGLVAGGWCRGDP